MRPRELCVEVVLEPLLGCMLLALRTVPVATGTMDTVLFPAAWALREVEVSQHLEARWLVNQVRARRGAV